MRELSPSVYVDTQFTDENLLYKHSMIEPVQLKQNLTYLWGKDSDMFPLLTTLEGNGAFTTMKPKALNDSQYKWKVFGRMKHTSRVVKLHDNITEPGKGQSSFRVIMEDGSLHHHYQVYTPDQKHQCRVQGEGKKIAEKQYLYTFTLSTGTMASYIDLSNFLAGKYWAWGATKIPFSKSDGTASNSMVPGEWTNQYGGYRYSKQIAGNVANKVTVIEFDLEGGGKTNMWMPFEMKLFEMDNRLLNETDLWTSEYNRDENGVIHLFDEDSGEPISSGAGVKQIIKTVNNYDTYSILTKAKLDSTVKSVFNNRVDDTPMEIVMYTGRGGAEMFHNAIMKDAVLNQYFVTLGDKNVKDGVDGYMRYGRYFRQYETIDGKLITIKIAKMFDHGVLAEQQRANGQMYEGYPWESYNMVFLDHSRTNDGDRNIMLIGEEGRVYDSKIYPGMSALPGSWGGIPDNFVATRRDIASYEVIGTQGIAITNPTTCFWLQFER